MFNHLFIEEHSEKFQNHFSQTSDVDSLKSWMHLQFEKWTELLSLAKETFVA